MVQIELDRPRLIVIEDRGKQYTLTVARIQKKQWLKYFEGILSTSENQGGKQINSFDSTSARLDLVEASLVNAKGYMLPEGTTAIDQLKDWKKMLPLGHRLGVANTLINVSQSEPDDDDPIVLGQETVVLDAVWGADADGVMRKFHGLRHNFKSPISEQQRRVSRESSRSRVVGGSRKGTTQWLGAQATLADLYDELIVSVEGYAVDGKTVDRDGIVEYMDTYHKVAAADSLFSPAAPKVEGESD